MFVTFGTAQASEQQNKRTRATNRACESCRKRKVRCDGKQPCAACQWQRKGENCTYQSQQKTSNSNTRKRPLPEDRSEQNVLGSLFPGLSVDDLANRSRDELVDMLKARGDPVVADGKYIDSEEEDTNLHDLQPLPEASADQSEASPVAQEDGVTDDVNALAPSARHSSSYLGVSSVIAVLRVIHWLDPSSNTLGKSIPVSNPTDEASAVTTQKTISVWDEVPAINAYFQYVQPFLPLLDEVVFRDTYVRKERQDDRWNLMLNSVLAMGSVVLHDVKDRTHALFFERAKQYLTLDTFASAHIEILQGMAILSGTYLHYVQKPNLANFLMGAISRMATTLGLHRDYTEALKKPASTSASPTIELRRRLWWCLLVMDSWGSNFLGRPTMGRIGPSHTTHVPTQPTNGSQATTSLLHANIEFCKLSTKFENLLAERPILSKRNRFDLDSSFTQWVGTPILRPSLVDESPGVICAANASRWRGLSALIFIQRPILLWYAMRKCSWSSLSEDKTEAIRQCRKYSHQLIQDIQATWKVPTQCQMAGWSATWQLYQATMVPLLSLFSDSSDEEVVQHASAHIEISLSTLQDLERWSPTAKRSYEVISRLLNQSHLYRTTVANDKQYTESNFGAEAAMLNTPSTTESGNMQDSLYLHRFVGDVVSWVGGDHDVTGQPLESSFLDYWDVGQEANGYL